MATSRPSVDDMRRALGADEPRPVHTAAHGPFGALQLAAELAERLQPGRGARPGRPTDPEWAVRRLVGFRRETWQRLGQIAADASTPQRRVSPAQVAAMLIEAGVERLKAG
jgi:hypothetical protein